MANTYSGAITLPATAALVTIAHNLGRTPHYLNVRPTISIASYRFTEVSRNASTYVVTAAASADAAGLVDVVFIHSSVR